jgi:hypothetical protein
MSLPVYWPFQLFPWAIIRLQGIEKGVNRLQAAIRKEILAGLTLVPGSCHQLQVVGKCCHQAVAAGAVPSREVVSPDGAGQMELWRLSTDVTSVVCQIVANRNAIRTRIWSRKTVYIEINAKVSIATRSAE